MPAFHTCGFNFIKLQIIKKILVNPANKLIIEFDDHSISSLNVPLALDFRFLDETTSSDSACLGSYFCSYIYSSTKASGTIPRYFLIQNLIAKNRAKPAIAKGSRIHKIITFADKPLGCSFMAGSLKLVI